MWKYIALKVAEWYRLFPNSGSEFEREQAKKYFEQHLLDWRLKGGVIDGNLQNKIASQKFNTSNPFYSELLEFKDWIYGDIHADQVKPYYINKTERRAIARDDRGL